MSINRVNDYDDDEEDEDATSLLDGESVEEFRSNTREPVEMIVDHSGSQPSRLKRMILMGTALFFSLTLSGVVFGWPAVVIMLEEQGVYRYLCQPGEELPCLAQVDQFNLIFTIASTGFACSVLPMGAVLDRFGPKVSSLIGSAFVLGGSVMFAFSDPPSIDMFIPGYLLIAIGGPPIVFSFMHISNLFPDNKGTIITMLNVGLDASSLMFVILGALFDGVQALHSYKVEKKTGKGENDMTMIFAFFRLFFCCSRCCQCFL